MLAVDQQGQGQVVDQLEQGVVDRLVLEQEVVGRQGQVLVLAVGRQGQGLVLVVGQQGQMLGQVVVDRLGLGLALVVDRLEQLELVVVAV